MVSRTKSSRVSRGSRSSLEQNNVFPPDPELPLVTLRVQILGASNLLSRDWMSPSDPFFVVSCLSVQHKTRVVKNTLNPSFEKDATFDFDIYPSAVDNPPSIELVAWDKDPIGSDYLGEASLPFKKWFRDVPEGCKYAWENVQPFDVPLKSTQEGVRSQGSVKVKLGFIKPQNSQHFMEFREIYAKIRRTDSV